MKDEDLSVAGPGSPVSLKKFIAWKNKTSPDAEGPTVIIDNGIGIVKDDPGTVIITPDDCKAQAKYFLENFWDGVRIPYYTIRHLLAMYELAEYDLGHTGKALYPDNESVKMAVMTKAINADTEHYKFLKNKFTYAEHDPEFMHILGLIQLVSGSVKKGAQRIFLDYPETFMHPKRERIVMCMLQEIQYDYRNPASRTSGEVSS